jgi:gluconolactonase
MDVRSPDFKHVYVSDTGYQTFPGATNATEPTSIYRFDVTPDGKRLENRQLFAYAARGLPDGIHTDTEGYVYSACGGGDGINV